MNPFADLSFGRADGLWLLLLAPLFLLAAWRFGMAATRSQQLTTLLRALAIAAVALAIAEPLIESSASGSSVVFVVDRSSSLPASSADAITNWVNDALSSAPASSEAAVVTYASNPVVSASMGASSSVASTWQQNGPSQTDATNLESALAVANALPASGGKRIVVLSDGAENSGSALAQATQNSIPIDTVYAPGIAASDLRLDAITGPAAFWDGDSANLTATIVSPAATTLDVLVSVDGGAPQRSTIAVDAGASNHPITLGVLSAGFHAISVQISPSDASIDPVVENDSLPAGIVVRDAPKVLYIAAENADAGTLSDALTRRGAAITTVTPERAPTKLSELAPFDAIVLNNVPASALSIEQVAAIDQAARSLGKGVIVTGGASSYGPGAYAGTQLEQMMPVTVKVTDGTQRPRVALLLIIDRSGSMTYNSADGVSKLDMAKEAAKLALTALADGDQIGVLAFNDRQQWVVPMTEINGQASRDAINASIDELKADSGTEVYPALQVGIDAIRTVDVDVRHVILLSDGKSRSGTRDSYESLVTAAARDRVSVSTIALGSDADTDLLQFIAKIGFGRYHFTNKPQDIPNVTLAEAQSAGSQAVVRGSFAPIQQEPSPIMTGFDPTQLPLLEGYDYAETKPDAQQVLMSPRGDPILATWQYGLGRVVAWTADDGTDFATAMRGWDGYDAFFSAIVRWALPDPDYRPVSISAARDGANVRFTLEATGAGGDTIDLAQATIDVNQPDGESQRLVPTQAGAGVWSATLPGGDTGVYQVTISWPAANGITNDTQAVVVPPSAELRPSGDGSALLTALAAQSGGKQRSLDDASGIFNETTSQAGQLHTYRPVWRWLLSAGLIFLLLEWSIRLRFWHRIAALASR
jgi:Mg-chelatase subunit ChlD